MAIDKKAIKDFAGRWKGSGYEKGDTQKFWLQLLQALGYTNIYDVDFEDHLKSGGFVDVWLKDVGVLIEQKSIQINLDKSETRQGVKKTPLEQALDYVDNINFDDRPRYIITCNFRQFRIYDQNKCGRSELVDNAFEFTLEELAKHPEYLNIIVDPKNSRLEKEKQISIDAGHLISKLYDLLREGYIDPDSAESQHALNVLCVRLVFCLYCEDADLFPKDAFYNYLKDVPPVNIRMNLQRLFTALDTPVKDRNAYDKEAVKDFPYVNGGLFEEKTEIPNFSEEAKNFLLNEVSAPFNWSFISPTIFGGIFESTLNTKTRKEGGMVYTSPDNIHKVIDPLFWDDLKKEFVEIRDNEEFTVRTKKAKYKAFHKKICSLKFMDPAAGSGNFLTETYFCLRKLEDKVLKEYYGGQGAIGFVEDEEKGTRISLNQFYGIEINDFAVKVAETALWISRLKANGDESMFLSTEDDFPLSEHATIVHANALQIDWNEVLPSKECSYIMGNPPFVARSSRVSKAEGGAKSMSTESVKEEKTRILGDNSGDLDYVVCWYMLASKYITNTKIRCAFVSTDSICRGEQVAPVWSRLLSEKISIDFAYQSFKWESDGDKPATVYVVIVGFSRTKTKEKKIYYENGRIEVTDHINPYLTHRADNYVWSRTTPFCEVPTLGIGSQPIDGQNYLFTEEEMNVFIQKEPGSKQYFHPWLGAEEMLSGNQRYVLWLGNATEKDLEKLPLCNERVQLVKKHRQKSGRSQTKKAAARPNHFATEIIPDSPALAIPETTTKNLVYLPMVFVSKDVFCSNKVRLAPNATIYQFGILQSNMHNAWFRAVCGYYGASYTYSSEIVYNNFIWPKCNKDKKHAVEEAAKGVLEARKKTEKTLSELYNVKKEMPPELMEAHKVLDLAVEKAYGVDFDGDEDKIVEYLFGLYNKKLKKIGK